MQDFKIKDYEKEAEFAANIYGAQGQRHLSQREQEGQLLLKAASSMQEIASNLGTVGVEDIKVAIEYNRTLWNLFYNKAADKAFKSETLRKNIMSLGNFVFTRSKQIEAENDNLRQRKMIDSLISINRQLANGLFQRVG